MGNRIGSRPAPVTVSQPAIVGPKATAKTKAKVDQDAPKPSFAQILDGIRKALPTTSRETIAKMDLALIDSGQPLMGASLKYHVADRADAARLADGSKKSKQVPTFTFKVKLPWNCNDAAQAAATRYFEAIGLPVVQPVEQFITVPKRGPDGKAIPGQFVKVPGYVKERIAGAKGQLEGNAGEWTESQRRYVMGMLPMLRAIGNRDIGTWQFKQLESEGGKEKLAFDGDIDCAGVNLTSAPLSRFDAFGHGTLTEHHLLPAAPEAIAFLFKDYVHGKGDLPFDIWRESVAMVQKANLSATQMADIWKPLTDAAFPGGKPRDGAKDWQGYKTPAEFIDTLMAVQKQMPADFAKFEAELKAEREANTNHRPSLGKLKHWIFDKEAAIGQWGVEHILAPENHLSQKQAKKRVSDIYGAVLP